MSEFNYAVNYNASMGQTNASTNFVEHARMTSVIGSNIQFIAKNVFELGRLAEQLGTPQDVTSLRDKTHKIQYKVNEKVKETSRQLQELSQMPATTTSEGRRQKAEQRRMAESFRGVLSEFKGVQKLVAEKQKAFVTRVRAASGLDSLDPFVDDGGTPQLIKSETPPAVQTQLELPMDETSVDLEFIRQQEREVFELEQNITDLNDTFVQLGTMVHDQGEFIDSIEGNMESAVEHVQEGNTQLKKAEGYAIKSRKKILVIVIIVLVVLTIFIAILATQLK